MNANDANLILGALDTFGIALADYKHNWTEGERAIYEQSTIILWSIISPEEYLIEYEI